MLSAQIKQKAASLGFAKVGIVRAEALTEEATRLREWLARGYQGEMQWMEREPEKRTDPQILMPGAKTVIVVLLNYFPSADVEDGQIADLGFRIADSGSPTRRSLSSLHKMTDDILSSNDNPQSAIRNPQSNVSAIRNPQSNVSKIQNPKPKISKYALADDYHDVVGGKLRELLAYIKELEPSVEGKVCVDTAPMMDKAWAVRAGLGWMGKHTNLITRELGSWVFIGEIVTNLELECDDEREKDRCGTCTACIDACPTGAIVEPYVVDSNRCISYATIELRAPELPREIADNLNGWLYGCDICQDVCPWNRFEKPTEEARFEPRETNLRVDLDEILAMTQEEFSERFRGSAMKRTKLSGLQRNARALKNKP